MAASSLSYSSRDGDVLDDIVWRHYGDQADGRLEAVLEANQNLSELGPVLSAGVVIVLPEMDDATTQETAALWG